MSADHHSHEAAPEERRHSSSVPGDSDPDRAARKTDVKAKEVQPGTGTPGRDWHSRSPVPDDEDDKLNQALKDSFPASDPPQPAQPGVTGWDVKDKDEREKKKEKTKRA
jgi:hypothetical protein